MAVAQSVQQPGVERPTTPATPVVSVVLPARNEAAVIERALREVDQLLSDFGLPYEIILGDSASSDGTVDVAQAMGNPRLRIVRADRPGKGRVLAHAFASARGTVVGFLDSDLETSAEYLRPAIVAVLLGADAAVGLPTGRTDADADDDAEESWPGFADRLLRLCLGEHRHAHAGITVFRRDSLLPLLPRVGARGWLWETELLAAMRAAGASIRDIPVRTSRLRPAHRPAAADLASAAIELAAVAMRVRTRHRPPAPETPRGRPNGAGTLRPAR